MDHARLYVVGYTVDPLGLAAHWVPTRASTKSSGELTGLTSGSLVSVRAHAWGTRGVTSAPATAGPKIVP